MKAWTTPAPSCLLLMLLAGALLLPETAQSQTRASVRMGWWSVWSDHFRRPVPGTGLELELGGVEEPMARGIAVAWFPNGRRDPGWVSMQAWGRLAGSIDRLRLSTRAGLGGLHIIEGRGVRGGWGMSALLGVGASLSLVEGLALSANLGRQHILHGIHRNRRMTGWALGLDYVFE